MAVIAVGTAVGCGTAGGDRRAVPVTTAPVTISASCDTALEPARELMGDIEADMSAAQRRKLRRRVSDAYDTCSVREFASFRIDELDPWLEDHTATR